VYYSKYHYYHLRFTVGPGVKKQAYSKADVGKEYAVNVTVNELHDVQAYLEQEFDARNIILSAETVETASLTDAEKASLVIDQL